MIYRGKVLLTKQTNKKLDKTNMKTKNNKSIKQTNLGDSGINITINMKGRNDNAIVN